MISRRILPTLLAFLVAASAAWAGPLATTNGAGNASNSGATIAAPASGTGSSGGSLDTNQNLATPDGLGTLSRTVAVSPSNVSPQAAAVSAAPSLGLSGPSDAEVASPNASAKAAEGKTGRADSRPPIAQVQVLKNFVKDVRSSGGAGSALSVSDMKAKMDAQYAGSKVGRSELPAEDSAQEWRALPPGASGKTYQVSDIPRLLETARSEDAYSAPRLYAQILDVLGDNPAQAARIRGEALKKVEAGVMRDLLKQALAAAASQDPQLQADAKMRTQAIYAWAGLFYPAGWRAFLDDTVFYAGRKVGLAEMIRDMAEGRLMALHAKSTGEKPSTLRFKYDRGAGQYGRMSIERTVVDASELAVPPLSDLAPASLISLGERENAAPPSMRPSFHLEPGPDFSGNFRRQRSSGHSVWSSFWLAARQYIADSGSLFARLLRMIGHWWTIHFGRSQAAGLTVSPNWEQLRNLPPVALPAFAH